MSAKDFTKKLLAGEEEQAPATAPTPKNAKTPKAPKTPAQEKELEAKYCVRLPAELLEDYRNLADFTGYTIKDLFIRALKEWSGYTETEAKRKELRKAKAGNKDIF